MKTIWNFLKSRFFWFNILAAIVLVAVICFVVFWRLDVYTRHGEAVEVPSLTGLYIEEAEINTFKEVFVGIDKIEYVIGGKTRHYTRE